MEEKKESDGTMDVDIAEGSWGVALVMDGLGRWDEPLAEVEVFEDRDGSDHWQHFDM